MTSPSKVRYRLADLHLNLFKTTYLISLDGSLFFKTSSMQEVRIYHKLTVSHSPLLSFIPKLIGIYKCKEDALDLLIDLSRDLSKIDLTVIESLLISTTKCRTSDYYGAIFTALKNLSYHGDTDSTDMHTYFVDLKLGFLTFPLDAQKGKILSQERKAKDTTTSSHGVRLMGAVLPGKNEHLAKNAVLVTKMDGRMCSYNDILTHICSVISNKYCLDQLIKRLSALSSSLQKECLHMCGPSVLIYSTPQVYEDNDVQHTDPLVISLIDFAHTYTQEQAVTLCTNEHTLSITRSTTIATCIDTLAHNLQVHYNLQHGLSSSSSSSS